MSKLLLAKVLFTHKNKMSMFKYPRKQLRTVFSSLELCHKDVEESISNKSHSLTASQNLIFNPSRLKPDSSLIV